MDKNNLKWRKRKIRPHHLLFFNGLKEKPIHNENDWLSHLCPQRNMKTNPRWNTGNNRRILLALAQNSYNFLLTNFANADTVGHSGNLKRDSSDRIYRYNVKLYEFIIKKWGNDNNQRSWKRRTNDKPINGKYWHRTQCESGAVIFNRQRSETKNSKRYCNDKNKCSKFLNDIAPTILDIMNMNNRKKWPENRCWND